MTAYHGQDEKSSGRRPNAVAFVKRQELLAAGWMQRESWIRSPGSVEPFLHRYYAQMPRTMLRYAIEKFSPDQRRQFLKGTFPLIVT